MRPIALLAVWLLSSGMAAPTWADSFIATIYGARRSCPGNCDAHVVFHEAHNGTKYASLPASPRTAPAACKVGRICRICFDDSDASCLTVMYRGEGPAKGRFDFTAAFYESACTKPGLPAPLTRKCRSFEQQYEELTANAVYCLKDRVHPGCRTVIAEAEAAKKADQSLWAECRKLGEARFNRKHPSQQRTHGCAYEKVGTGGPNSKNETWKRLMPAACKPGAYVGRDGLDCCDASKISLGGLGQECTNYTVPK